MKNKNFIFWILLMGLSGCVTDSNLVYFSPQIVKQEPWHSPEFPTGAERPLDKNSQELFKKIEENLIFLNLKLPDEKILKNFYIPDWKIFGEKLNEKDYSRWLFHLNRIKEKAYSKNEVIFAKKIEAKIYQKSQLFEDELKILESLDFDQLEDQNFLRLSELYFYQKKSKDLTLSVFNKITNTDSFPERDKEIFSFLKQRLYFQKIPLHLLGASKDENISSIFLDSDDLWFGSWDGTWGRYNLTTNQTEIIRQGDYGIKNDSIRNIFSRGFVVFIASANKLYMYSKNSQKYSLLKLPKNFERIQQVFISSDDRIFILTLGEGLWVYQFGLWQQIDFPDFPVFWNTIFELDQKFFLGSMDKGLWQLSWDVSSGQKIFASGLPKNITTISVKEKKLLLGTFGEGLFLYDILKNSTLKLKIQNKDNWIISAAELGRYFIFGTLGGTLILLNKNSETILPENNSFSLLGDVTGLVYASPFFYAATLGDGIIKIHEDVLEK